MLNKDIIKIMVEIAWQKLFSCPFVFFYNEVDPDAHAILAELEGIDIDILEFADLDKLNMKLQIK